MSTEQPGCRILQDLNHGTHFRQIPAYAHKEIAQMHREIVWRFSELKQILARQREALKALIERMKSSHTLPEDCLAIVEYPYFALWIHVSAIQQLKRALHIYKHKRMKWIYQIALDSFLKSSSALSHQSIMTTELDSRLSRSEKDFLCRLHQLICRYGNAMGAVLSAQTEKNFSQAAREVFENVHVYIPDAAFHERMSQLGLVMSSCVPEQWSFENVVLPQLNHNKTNEN